MVSAWGTTSSMAALGLVKSRRMAVLERVPYFKIVMRRLWDVKYKSAILLCNEAVQLHMFNVDLNRFLSALFTS